MLGGGTIAEEGSLVAGSRGCCWGRAIVDGVMMVESPLG